MKQGKAEIVKKNVDQDSFFSFLPLYALPINVPDLYLHLCSQLSAYTSFFLHHDGIKNRKRKQTSKQQIAKTDQQTKTKLLCLIHCRVLPPFFIATSQVILISAYPSPPINQSHQSYTCARILCSFAPLSSSSKQKQRFPCPTTMPTNEQRTT